MGARVNEFALGMGPKVFGVTRGDTLYTLRALPLGGFCAIEGEDGDITRPESLGSKTPLQRIIVFAAGAFMNFILAWLLLSIYLGYLGHGTNTVLQTIPDSPIANAGVQAGETIISIDGQTVETQAEISAIVVDGTITYDVVVKGLDGNLRTVPIQPEARENGNGAALGFYPTTAPNGFFESIWNGLLGTFSLTGQVFDGFTQLITGRVAMSDMAGIVGVAQVTSEVWDSSVQESLLHAIMNLIYIGALLSANLAVLNLLPMPALDGGRILFTFIEMLRGKPLDQEKEGMIHLVGFVLLMGLMVVVFYNDIVRLMS
ncbi:MAG: hypothetical protein ATN36_05950 [Epulopiscium sp. Nele67-Bin005]|nr:MAG: hypothetical protein ATN36_05950 [Epulopiscium sp. Nele67-Bin005]